MDYYIHTFEIKKYITYDQYCKIKTPDFYPDKKYSSELYPFLCTGYSQSGLKTISIRKVTPNDSYNCSEKRNYCIVIEVNPSRLLNPGTFNNCIFTIRHLDIALNILDDCLNNLFQDVPDFDPDLNSFKLQRCDLTKDFFQIPESIIQELLLLLRRFPLGAGFSHNIDLEKNCPDYAPENSINILSKSSQVEFVLYNKHAATIDMNYPESEKEYYEDVLRLELRCMRKAIRESVPHDSTVEQIKHLFSNALSIVQFYYWSIFPEYSSCSFLSESLLYKRLNKEQTPKHLEKMERLVALCKKHPEEDIRTLGIVCFDNNLTKYKKVRSYFTKAGVAPIRITNNEIPFIQSLSTLLEMEPIDKEQKLYDYAVRKTRSKEVFFHDQRS